MSSIARFDTWQAADGTNVARYNAGVLETWTGSAWAAAGGIDFQFVVVAGGGGGGNSFGGGGGAGGYRSSVPGEYSAGPSLPEATLEFFKGDSFTVTVGAGGAAGVGGTYPNRNPATDGSDSVFGSVTSLGGGRGATYSFEAAGIAGGSSGGSSYITTTKTPGAVGQGTAGGGNTSTGVAGGGGGAGEPGDTDGLGHGGDGIQTSITGTPTYLAGGGGGGGDSAGPGGEGGGGAGATLENPPPTSGTANTGGGGGGVRGGGNGTSSSGGSGIVILKYPATTSLTIGAGLTASTVTSGDYKITSFTAGSDTVTVA